MYCQIGLVVLCLAVMAQATPIYHEPAGGRYVIHDPTGHTVYGGGDENRDNVLDAADTNRDGKPDAVVYHHPMPVYHHTPYYHHGFAHHAGYFPGAAYYPYGGAYYPGAGAAALVH